MLIRDILQAQDMPRIKKESGGVDVSTRGCFAKGDVIIFTAEVPRSLGASAVVMRICRDNDREDDMPLRFVKTDFSKDIYSLTLDTAQLCREDDGLFYYEFLFLRGFDTLFTQSENNFDFTLDTHSDSRFLLMIYRRDMSVPEWFAGSTMYQIFVDRFCVGKGRVTEKQDVILNEDWDGGMVQYSERAGESLKNNMFFGGNLWGVVEKLPYLSEMGVNVIYLNPIFEAYSNHKYDTGDYLLVDGMFGGEEAFEHLVREAERYGMRVILDGVFNHTGDDSRYFDRYGKYGGEGAYNSPLSPYRDWYSIDRDGRYRCWWGVEILPRLNHENEQCRRFFTSPQGVGAHYVKKGIGGWRLDVADELSDEFLDEFYCSVKEAGEQRGGDLPIIIGEVWESAAEKIAYGKRRRYLRGGQLDSVMNYPLRSGVLRYILQGDAKFLANTLISIYSTYPRAVCNALMNILGTHDTERILTVLGKGDAEVSDECGSTLAYKRLDEAQRERARAALKVASLIQYTVFGVPSLYYGDEAGMEGYRDPFCRMPYPWGREDEEIRAHYRMLGEIRQRYRQIFATGEFRILRAEGGVLVYSRSLGEKRLIVCTNVGSTEASVDLEGRDVLSGNIICKRIASMGYALIEQTSAQED